jgi:16S rRNA (uracil1498-N3)-methyltransferase
LLTVACAVPKKCKIDDSIDKVTQLGVYRIIPLATERVIVKFEKNKEDSRLVRWRRIALSASQQSQRNSLPIVDPLTDIKVLLSNVRDFDLKLIPTLGGKRKDLSEVIVENKVKNILVLIGPEGDFTENEVSLAISSGCIPISLGDLVLRVDTAAIAVASFIKLLRINEKNS